MSECDNVIPYIEGHEVQFNIHHYPVLKKSGKSATPKDFSDFIGKTFVSSSMSFVLLDEYLPPHLPSQKINLG